MIAAQPSALRGAETGLVRVRASAGAAVAATRTFARRLARGRQVDFWMREIDPAWSLSTLRARVVDVRAETHDVSTFVLAPNGLWPGHRAGQFVSVEVEVDGVRMERCYSLSSAPGDEHVTITVKRVPGGRVSSWMHDHVRRGDVLRLGMPAGEFVVPASPLPGKLLLLSGGSGVTPVMSILRDLTGRGAVGDVAFVQAARSKRDLVFERELAELAATHPGLRLAFFLDDEIRDRTRGGRLDSTKLRVAVPDLDERETMLCGPAAMMDALSPTWTEAGIAHRLKTERFAAAPRVEVPAGATPSRVKLALVRSGRTVITERSESLLEQLERAGESPASGCRMGICNTCLCRKRTGVVENVVTGELSSEPDEDIRLCVSRARTDIELTL
jgi:ferredoxin-NADP reductase